MISRTLQLADNDQADSPGGPFAYELTTNGPYAVAASIFDLTLEILTLAIQVSSYITQCANAVEYFSPVDLASTQSMVRDTIHRGGHHPTSAPPPLLHRYVDIHRSQRSWHLKR